MDELRGRLEELLRDVFMGGGSTSLFFVLLNRRFFLVDIRVDIQTGYSKVGFGDANSWVGCNYYFLEMELKNVALPPPPSKTTLFLRKPTVESCK